MSRTAPASHPAAALNGARVSRKIDGAILIALPPHLWRPAGRCSCPHCNGRESYWDAVAVAVAAPEGRADTTWTVHAPELTRSHEPRLVAPRTAAVAFVAQIANAAADAAEARAELAITTDFAATSRRIDDTRDAYVAVCADAIDALAPLFPAE